MSTRRRLARHPAPSTTRVSSGFGARVHPVTGERSFHNGVDFAAPAGSPVVAADDGVVRFVLRWDGLPPSTTTTPSGNAVGMDRGDGVTWSYSHLSRVDVVVGQRLKRGDAVGLVGSTGRSTGPHLHFRTDVDGQTVDPVSLLPLTAGASRLGAWVLGATVLVGGGALALYLRSRRGR
jgi:murein DD-endopeptidase MepM/ murein hydrolase activator NlpD